MSTAARDRRSTRRLDPDDLEPLGEHGLWAWTGSDGAGATAASQHLRLVR